jgi:hypothetical protein
MKNSVMIILVLVFFAGGFLAGMKYQQNKQPSRADFQPRMGMMGSSASEAQTRAGAGVVRGEIIAQDETSITVKLPDESSKIVLLSENTTINKASEASIADLEAGKEVMVFGQTNSDGSISASDIQVGLGFRFERTPQLN